MARTSSSVSSASVPMRLASATASSSAAIQPSASAGLNDVGSRPMPPVRVPSARMAGSCSTR